MKKLIRYHYYVNTTTEPCSRFHIDRACLFAAKLMGLADHLCGNSCYNDNNRCRACNGYLRNKPRKAKNSQTQRG